MMQNIFTNIKCSEIILYNANENWYIILYDLFSRLCYIATCGPFCKDATHIIYIYIYICVCVCVCYARSTCILCALRVQKLPRGIKKFGIFFARQNLLGGGGGDLLK